MIEKSHLGYKVYKIKDGKKLYIKSIYNEKVSYVYDYSHARAYKDLSKAEKISKKYLTK